MDSFKLENQLCFRAYTASRLTIRLYKPFLDQLKLTYPQYVTLLILWEEKTLGFRDLGKKLHMKTGTLTPVIQRLDKLGYVEKLKDPSDDRKAIVTITDIGMSLLPIASEIPEKIAKSLGLTKETYIKYASCMDEFLEKLYIANGLKDEL